MAMLIFNSSFDLIRGSVNPIKSHKTTKSQAQQKASEKCDWISLGLGVCQIGNPRKTLGKWWFDGKKT